MLDLYQSFNQYNIPFLQSDNSNLYFTLLDMVSPALEILQENINILSLIDDVQGYMTQISFNEIIVVGDPPNQYLITESDKMDFLSIIGNIVGLPPFSLPAQNGFILDTSQLDLTPLGGIGDIVLISSAQYARCLMARFIKFYDVASIDNIYNSVVLVSQGEDSNVTATFSGNDMNFTITNSVFNNSELFIDYLDQYGYNLWVKPSYGTINFTYS